MCVRGFVVDCSPEEYQLIREAAGGEDKMDEFILQAALREVSYIMGLDQIYLDEYVETDKGGIT